MTASPVLRLAAIQLQDSSKARRLLTEAYGAEPPNISDSIDVFERRIERAICIGERKITLTIEVAELIAVALKDRRGSVGRARLTRAQRLRNSAAVSLARQLKQENLAKGMRAGEAAEVAAKEAAGLAGAYGCTLAWTTIMARMSKRDRKPAN